MIQRSVYENKCIRVVHVTIGVLVTIALSSDECVVIFRYRCYVFIKILCGFESRNWISFETIFILISISVSYFVSKFISLLCISLQNLQSVRQFNIRYRRKKVHRKVQGVPQSQTAANTPTPRGREKWQKLTRTKQTNKCTRSTRTSSLFPQARWSQCQNEWRNTSTKCREDFKTWSTP